MNRKREGYLSIMVLFIFLFCTLTILFVLVMLERRAVLGANYQDSVQAQYIPESMGNYYFEEILSTIDFTRENQVLQGEQFVHLPFMNLKQGDITNVQVRYDRRKRQNDYPTFSLTIASHYKKIGATATYMGELVDPLFRPEENIIFLEEVEEEDREKIDSLLNGGYLEKANANLPPIVIDEPSLLERGARNSQIIPLSSQEERSKEVTYVAPNITRYYEVASPLTCSGNNYLTGVLRVRPEGAILGDITLYGILILEEGAELQGTITVEGLVIGSKEYAGKIRTRKNPQKVSELLGEFPGFYEPKIRRVKKGFI